MIAYLGGLATAAAIGAVALLIGPSGPGFALVAHLLAMAWISAVVSVRRPDLTAVDGEELAPSAAGGGTRGRSPRGGWFAVRDWEERAWRWAGIGPFRALLRAVGWERVIIAQRGFDGTRAGLAELARHTRASECCHLVVAALGALAVVVAAVCGDLPAVLWLGGATVAFHLHPVLLQRALRARIVRLQNVKQS